MNNSRPIVNISLLLGTIIAVSAFFLVFNNIPVQALHKEQQLLESFDDLADFAKAVRNGDANIEEIPIQSMKAANIYDDADNSLKDCIDQAAKIGDSLTDREVVHCVDDVNYFNNKYSNTTVPTTATSTATTGLEDTGADTTSTSNAADTTSTSDNSNENNLVDELVKTGKFTEAEAREFVNNNMQSELELILHPIPRLLMQIPTLLIPHQLLMQIPTLLIPRLLMQIPTLLIILRPMTLPQPTTKTTIINLQIITAIILKTITTLTSWLKI
ncbi:MAG: hypothetical protein M3O68_04605 [Thermoproteota archaeon]|nr:hypothetical protein [Thermoproteota archaeon]